MELQWLGDNQVFRGPRADVAVARERSRQRRLGRIALPGALLCLWM